MESSSSTITDKNTAVEEDYGDVDGIEIECGGGGRVDAAEIECGGGGGGGRVDAAGNTICNNHTFKVNNSNGNNPATGGAGGGGGGGICAFCLQDKLGKLVSSSFPLTIFPSSSSSSPSFRSELDIVASGNGFRKNSNDSYLPNYQNHHRLHHQLQHRREQQYYSSLRRGGRIIPFLLYHQNKKKNKKKETLALSSSEFCSDPKRSDDVLKRSKSTATPRSGRFLDVDDRGEKRGGGFWSFFYHTKSSRKTVTTVAAAATTTTTEVSSSSFYPKRGNDDNVDEKEKESPNSSHGNAAAAASSSSFERKVSRSRSVGCGSRSFHGDFFDRISTGLGDCTLRRVESQREAKSKAHSSAGPGVLSEHHQHHYIKERVKCGGIFGGFILTSSLSSSSSSSYWISSSADDINTSKTTTTTSSSASVASGPVLHNRSKSWGWALASPIRAFSKPSSNKNGNSNKNTTTTVSPNLSAIPSLLSVTS